MLRNLSGNGYHKALLPQEKIFSTNVLILLPIKSYHYQFVHKVNSHWSRYQWVDGLFRQINIPFYSVSVDGNIWSQQIVSAAERKNCCAKVWTKVHFSTNKKFSISICTQSHHPLKCQWVDGLFRQINMPFYSIGVDGNIWVQRAVPAAERKHAVRKYGPSH